MFSERGLAKNESGADYDGKGGGEEMNFVLVIYAAIGVGVLTVVANVVLTIVNVKLYVAMLKERPERRKIEG